MNYYKKWRSKKKKVCHSFKYINIMRITIVYSMFRCDSPTWSRGHCFLRILFSFTSFRTEITPFYFQLLFTESSSSVSVLDPASVLPMPAIQSKGRPRAPLAQQATYPVERILNHKRAGTRSGGDWLFLIKWRGYPDSANTWEPEENVTNRCIN